MTEKRENNQALYDFLEDLFGTHGEDEADCCCGKCGIHKESDYNKDGNIDYMEINADIDKVFNKLDWDWEPNSDDAIDDGIDGDIEFTWDIETRNDENSCRINDCLDYSFNEFGEEIFLIKRARDMKTELLIERLKGLEEIEEELEKMLCYDWEYEQLERLRTVITEVSKLQEETVIENLKHYVETRFKKQ